MCDQQEKYGAALNTKAEQGISRGLVGAYETEMRRRRIEPINADIVAHHVPDEGQIQRIVTLCAAARNFMDAIDANCPECADRTAAKRKVREALFTANAAIVLNGEV